MSHKLGFMIYESETVIRDSHLTMTVCKWNPNELFLGGLIGGLIGGLLPAVLIATIFIARATCCRNKRCCGHPCNQKECSTQKKADPKTEVWSWTTWLLFKNLFITYFFQ